MDISRIHPIAVSEFARKCLTGPLNLLSDRIDRPVLQTFTYDCSDRPIDTAEQAAVATLTRVAFLFKTKLKRRSNCLKVSVVVNTTP